MSRLAVPIRTSTTPYAVTLECDRRLNVEALRLAAENHRDARKAYIMRKDDNGSEGAELQTAVYGFIKAVHANGDSELHLPSDTPKGILDALRLDKFGIYTGSTIKISW